MFAELNALLGVSVEKPEEGKLTLLCATKTDADFLTHHFLSFYLKAGCRVCFVALVQSFSHYSIVAQKLGISLPAAKDRGQLVFLEGLKSSCEVLFSEERQSAGPNPFQFISGDGSSLKPLYEFVRTALSPAAGEDSWKCPVLIVDNLSVLLSLGLRPVDVLDFLHYCRVAVISQLKARGIVIPVVPERLELHILLRLIKPSMGSSKPTRAQGNIVVMTHSSDDSEDEESELLFGALRHQSNRILWAEGLATGFCKDIHGELRITQRSSWEKRAERDLVHTFQYKVQDKNVTFFARGMSAAVL